MYLRLDDYPYGTPRYGGHTREWCCEKLRVIARVLERYAQPYILGVPLLNLLPSDVELLNDTVGPAGRVVMHGYTHGFERWSEVMGLWAQGGEFAGASLEKLLRCHAQAMHVAAQLESFDAQHFIAPFNVYTQTLLDALQRTPVRYIHTTERYYQRELQHGRITPVLGVPGYVYQAQPSAGQIVLHWALDAGVLSDEELPAAYERLCISLQ